MDNDVLENYTEHFGQKWSKKWRLYIEKQQLSVLCSLPGVAEKSAIRLLEKFGTPLDVLCAPVTELAKTPGLGEAKAKKIKKMLQNKNKNFKKSGQKTLHES